MVQESMERLEEEFVSLVKKSWQIHEVYLWNNSVDEMLIGAVINSSLEKGYLLIDVKSEHPYAYSSVSTGVSDSDPTTSGFQSPISSHFLRFEDPKNNSRLLYELTRITKDLAEAKTLGHLARVTIGYGEKAKNFGDILSALKHEFKSTFVDTSEPGIITLDADTASGYIYAKVSIILNISAYNKDNKHGSIDYEKLNLHIEAVVHSLKKYLVGRGLI